mmetsp:Transcript_78664/g.228303  ORF Transcript_78664/g.228303 Transcript_78664/m.228303 type:complete len:211 (+) Transcript_78664:384-1016(+)
MHRDEVEVAELDRQPEAGHAETRFEVALLQLGQRLIDGQPFHQAGEKVEARNVGDGHVQAGITTASGQCLEPRAAADERWVHPRPEQLLRTAVPHCAPQEHGQCPPDVQRFVLLFGRPLYEDVRRRQDARGGGARGEERAAAGEPSHSTKYTRLGHWHPPCGGPTAGAYQRPPAQREGQRRGEHQGRCAGVYAAACKAWRLRFPLRGGRG